MRNVAVRRRTVGGNVPPNDKCIFISTLRARSFRIHPFKIENTLLISFQFILPPPAPIRRRYFAKVKRSVDETHDVVGLGDDRFSNGGGTLRPLGQHAVDLGHIAHQAGHFGADRRQLVNGEVGERRLEAAEL